MSVAGLYNIDIHTRHATRDGKENWEKWIRTRFQVSRYFINEFEFGPNVVFTWFGSRNKNHKEREG